LPGTEEGPLSRASQ